MADSRRDSSPWLPIIHEIDQAFDRINTAFIKAFSEGQDKPTEPQVVSKVRLFEEVWALIDRRKQPEFPTLKELQQFYQNITNTLPNFIHNYCVFTLGIKEDDITQNKRNMLSQLVNVYYVLYRQKFLLNKFKSGDEPAEFVAYISSVLKDTEEAEKLINGVQTQTIVGLLAVLETAMQAVAACMKEQGYLASNYKFDRVREAQNDRRVARINELIQGLPDYRLMQKTTEDFEAARKAENKDAVEQYRGQIQGYMTALGSTRTGIDGILGELFQSLQSACDELNPCVETIAARLNGNRMSSRLVDIYRLIRELNGYDENENATRKGYKTLLDEAAKDASKVCSEQSAMEKWSLGFWAKGWRLAGIELETTLPSIAKKIDLLMEDYANPHLTLEKVKTLKQRKADLNALYARMRNALAQSRKAWQESSEGLARIQEILTTYINARDENLLESCKTFIRHHWWKIGLGAGGGGGGGASVAVFALALHPAGIALLAVSAAVLGGAGVAGAMAAKEQLIDTDNAQSVPQENQSLLNDGRSRSNYGSTIRAETPVAPVSNASSWRNGFGLWAAKDAAPTSSASTPRPG